MSLKKFDELRQNKTFLDYSNNHTIDEVKQKILSENLEKSADAIIRYVSKYGFFEFERIEKESGDTIFFRSYPLWYINPYWEDFNEKAAYIGEYTNSSCGDNPKISFIERFYMLSDGSFYNQDKKKIADNDEDFFEYILTVEYDYHSPISENTYKRLKEFGWYENRKIDISVLINECEQDGVLLTEHQKVFLKEFGGIKGIAADGQVFYISDKRSCHGQLVYFTDISCDEDLQNQLDPDDIEIIIQKYGRNTVYIGNCHYYSDPILLTESGNMLLVNCGEVKPLGRTVMEGFNVLLGD